MKRLKVRARLKKAGKRGTLLNLTRRFESWRTTGYVVDLSDDWILLHQVYDARFIGWMALRIDDITRAWPEETCTHEGLKKRGELPKSLPEIQIRSAYTILGSAHRVFPLISLYTENLEANSCWIGRVNKLSQKSANLIIISPQAEWNSQDKYRLKDISRIDFGANYESLLWEMGSKNAPEALVI